MSAYLQVQPDWELVIDEVFRDAENAKLGITSKEVRGPLGFDAMPSLKNSPVFSDSASMTDVKESKSKSQETKSSTSSTTTTNFQRIPAPRPSVSKFWINSFVFGQEKDVFADFLVKSVTEKDNKYLFFSLCFVFPCFLLFHGFVNSGLPFIYSSLQSYSNVLQQRQES
jgi:hypothetical protein